MYTYNFPNYERRSIFAPPGHSILVQFATFSIQDSSVLTFHNGRAQLYENKTELVIINGSDDPNNIISFWPYLWVDFSCEESCESEQMEIVIRVLNISGNSQLQCILNNYFIRN